MIKNQFWCIFASHILSVTSSANISLWGQQITCLISEIKCYIYLQANIPPCRSSTIKLFIANRRNPISAVLMPHLSLGPLLGGMERNNSASIWSVMHDALFRKKTTWFYIFISFQTYGLQCSLSAVEGTPDVSLFQVPKSFSTSSCELQTIVGILK